MVNEATRLGVPIVGLVDSTAELKTFSKITYPVPCNDSAQFVYLFCNLITKTFLHEKKRMKEEEEEGGDVGLKGRIKAAVDESLKNSSSSSSNSSSSEEEESDPSSDSDSDSDDPEGKKG